MATEKIMTLHPEGKKGVNISKAKYDQIRETVLAIMENQTGITYTALADAVGQRLEGKFDGSIQWYTVSIKLDLEARGIIERIPKTSPHQVRLVQK